MSAGEEQVSNSETESATDASSHTHLARRIARLGDGNGPLLIVTGGMHGNEPGGTQALERVAANLEERGLSPRGTLLALSGNLAALRSGQRYIERDLNRMWTEGDLAAARSSSEPSAEQLELLDLYDAITDAIASANGPVLFLDLHSTSAEGSPFALIGDTLANRDFAFSLGLPVILGLEENVDGTLLSWFGEQGYVAIGVEGGQHDDPGTTRHQEATVWLALLASGLFHEDELPWAAEQRRVLRRASSGLPPVVAVELRHGIRSEDRFRMVPGYVNFDAVVRGEVLAHDRRGPIRAAFTGNILLPLYQGRGADGFFLGRPVRRFWLGLSRFLRALKFERFLHWLPVGGSRGCGRSTSSTCSATGESASTTASSGWRVGEKRRAAELASRAPSRGALSGESRRLEWGYPQRCSVRP
ncbi:MAG: succinylglutamate desuccinylase/aspartoacylase family protein [Planctomycetota bacterium]